MADDQQARAAEGSHLRGKLEATREQLAAAEALAQQLQAEVAVARAEEAAARRELAQLNRHADDRVRTAEQRVEDLRADLELERRRCQAAEEERAALVAALGRRARKRLGPAAS